MTSLPVAEKRTQIYEKILLPFNKMFLHKNNFWILQKDNDPEYLRRLCTPRKEEHGINMLNGPYTPLMPIQLKMLGRR